MNWFQKTKCLTEKEIRAYNNGSGLNAAQLRRVEAHIIDCPFCADALEGLEALAPDEEIPSVPGMESPAPVRKINWYSRIAAGLLLFLVPASLYFYWDKTNPQRLFTSNFQSFENTELLTMRGEENQTDFPEKIKQGLKLYDLEKYEESLLYFNDQLKTEPENTRALFYAGMAYLETNQYENARTNLALVRFNDEKRFEEATWYLALTCLRQNEPDLARQYLMDLSELKGGFYEEDAKALLEEL